MAEYRTRNWLTIVYPESAPENWIELLDDLHVAAFVSPLHSHDVNVTGEPKKAHYHVCLMYDSVKCLKQVKEDVACFGGVQPMVCKSLRGTARYLCHLDNPEKYQYNISDVRCFAGADYDDCIRSESDKLQSLREMEIWCETTATTSYRVLVAYARDNRPDWYRRLHTDCREDMYLYCRSLQWEYDRLDALG